MTFEKPSRELTIGEIISLSFSLYQSRFTLFFVPFLAVGLITGILNSLFFEFLLPAVPPVFMSPEQVWSYFFAVIAAAFLVGIVSFIIGQIATGMVVKSASDILEKGTSTLDQSFDFVVSKLLSLLGAAILIGIIVGIGLLLLIIPGIIFWIWFSLVVPAIIIEQKDVFESMSRSRRLVSNRWLKTFVLFLLVGLILFIVGIIAVTIAAPLGIAGSIVSSIITAFVTPLVPLATTFFYYSMLAKETPLPPPPPPPNL